MSEHVPSPCVSICALDDKDICVGCFRSGEEISQWGKMNNEQKKAVLQSVSQREYESMYPADKASNS